MTTRARKWGLAAVAAALIAGSGNAAAQRATISPASASATEQENLEFTISGSWTYDVEIAFYTEGITATADDDFYGYAEPWHLCVPGSNDLGGVSPDCEFGGATASETANIVHLTDDLEEGNETYRVVAYVTRWETGAVQDGWPVVQTCSGTSCGRTTATGTIIDYQPEPEPERPGEIAFSGTTTTSVEEGSSATLSVTYTPASSPHSAASAEWSTEDDSAVAGRDYPAASGTLRFRACSSACGVQTASITVRTTEDRVSENDETFLVNLANPTNARLTTSFAVVSIADDDENEPPVVTASANDLSLGAHASAGSSVRLSASGSDVDGTIESYGWAGPDGWTRSGRTTSWRAPEPRVDTTYTFTVTATDNDGASATDSVDVVVDGPDSNQAPTVRLRSNNYSVAAGGTARLGARGDDDSGLIRRYTWTGTGSFAPRVAEDDGYPSGQEVWTTWTAPSPATHTTYRLSVEAEDYEGKTGRDSISIQVAAADAGEGNEPPTVTLTAGATEVAAGGTVTLTAAASDGDGEIESYEWRGEGSFSTTTVTATGGQVTWTAPSPREDTSYTLTVRVTDDGGLGTTSEGVAIAVEGTDTNVAPTVSLSAGKGTVDAGGEVVLTAIGTDDGPLSYAWSGEGTFRTTGTEGRVVWTAPRPAAQTDYTLTVTVTDEDAATATDSVSVTVRAEGVPEPQGNPVLSIETAVVREGQNGTVSLTLDKQAEAGASVRYRIGKPSGMAADHNGKESGEGCVDYDHAEGTVNLGARSAATITVRTRTDTCVDEPGELITVHLFDPVKVGLETDTAQLVIENVYSTVGFLSTDDMEVAEGGTARLTLVRPVTETGQRVAASVEVAVRGNRGAVAGEDFEAGPKTVRFSPNETSKNVSFRVLADDEYDEEGERVVVEVRNGVGARTTDDTVIVNIVDPDGTTPEVGISVAAVTTRVREGGTVRCAITAEEVGGRALDGDLRVKFFTTASSGEAEAGVDYTAKSEWVSFDRSASQTRAVTVATRATQANRGDRELKCTIGSSASNSDNYTYTGEYRLRVVKDFDRVTIENRNVTDQDTGTSRGPVWAHDTTTTEQSLGLWLHLNGELPDRVGGGKDALKVTWRTSSEGDATATAGSDYTTKTGTYTFRPDGARSFRIHVPIACDTVPEKLEEHFYIKATGRRERGAQVGGESSVKITIRSDPDGCGGLEGRVSVSDGSATEGEQVVFVVSLEEELEEDIDLHFDYATSDGTAQAGTDYTASSGETTIHRNETRRSIRIDTLSDSVRDEGETFRLTISNVRTYLGPVGIADGTGTGTIVESQPIATEFRRVPISHSRKPLEMELHLSAELDATAEEVTAAINAASTGAELTATKSRYLVWELAIAPDGAGNITVGLDHTAVFGHDGRAVAALDAVLIYGRPTVSVADSEADETDHSMPFTVSLDQTHVERVSVNWQTSDGTAINGQDYESASGSLRFEPGETEKKIRVKLFQTTQAEEDETFTVQLGNVLGAYLDPANDSATGTIKDTALGAQFSQPADARTDGSNFIMGLRFHPAVENVDLSGLRGSFRVTGGRVTAVAPKTAGDDRNFVLTVDPSGEGHVEITLPRGTKVGDRRMQYDATVRVSGPVRIGISDAEATESNDSELVFEVSLNQGPVEEVTVDYATEDGTATAGNDYTAASGTLTFGENETRKRIRVAVIDDEVNEGDETLTVKLSNAAGATISDDEGVGTIKNQDALPIALIARFGRAMASHIVDQVQARIDAPRRGGGHAKVGGQLLPLARALIDEEQRRGGPDGGRRERDPLAGGLGFGQRTRDGGVLSFWTRRARSSFTGTERTIAMGGDVETTMVGADYARGRWITGMTLARSLGKGTYAGSSQGEVAAGLTGLYPWVSYDASERVNVWTVAGYGAGRLALATGGQGQEAATSMAMIAAGSRAALGRGAGLNLAMRSDALWVGTRVAGATGPDGNLAPAKAAVTRVRTAIEGSRRYRALGRMAVEPSIEVGIRRDDGDAETGTGVDLGAGITVADAASGLGIDVRFRTVVAHQAEGFREQGMAVTVSYAANVGGRGLQARISPAWGANTSGLGNGFWREDGQWVVERGEPGASVDAELGYGLPAGPFIGTPRFGFRSDSYGRTYRAGYGLGGGERGSVLLNLGFDVERREGQDGPGAGHGAAGRLNVSW